MKYAIQKNQILQHQPTLHYVYPHILVATIIANLTDIVINNNHDILVCSPRVLPLHNFLLIRKLTKGLVISRGHLLKLPQWCWRMVLID